MVFGMALLLVLAVVGEARAEDLGLNGPEDFQQLARQGFLETINNAGDFVANLGSRRNNYAWAGAWFLGKFFVGTARDVYCFLIDPTDPSCPPPGEFTSDQRAEIWAYTPAPGVVGGINGTWQRVFQSPDASSFLLPGWPRDLGYRNAQVCNFGGAARLFFATFGIGGRIIYTTNGTTFSTASTEGMFSSLVQAQNGTADLGYRSLLCWKGRLWTAPAGSTEDEDVPVHPVLLSNSNPISTSSAWQTIVNVATHPTLGDPENLGIFSAAIFNDNIYIGVGNRTTGMQVWRAPGATCNPPPGSCTLNWVRIVTGGGGRTIPAGQTASSAGISDFAEFNGALYAGASDAAAFEVRPAELIRVHSDDRWDLVMGEPRDPVAAGAAFLCGGAFVAGKCQSLSGRGPGFGSTPTGIGQASYLWRLEAHDGFLYSGSLDLCFGFCSPAFSANPGGFDLLRSADGVTWSNVDLTGLGNPFNYGVRVLVSVPDWPDGPALVLGSANPFTPLDGTVDPGLGGSAPFPTGGAELFVGTCAPEVPPVAVPGTSPGPILPGLNVFFGTPEVTVNLDGRKSSSPFCGHLAAYEWYEGDLTGSCDIGGATPFASGATPIPLVPRTLPSGSAGLGADFKDYSFTLRVVDDKLPVPQEHCALYNLRASLNNRPLAQLLPEPDFSANPDWVDFNGDGFETRALAATCSDPEAQGVNCVLSGDPGATIAAPNVLADPGGTLNTSVTVVLNEGSDRTRIIWTATDNLGYQRTDVASVRVRAPVHNVEVRSFSPIPAAGTEGATQQVTGVRVRNLGDFTETNLTVTLADATGGTVIPSSQPIASLAPGATQSLTFGWTPNTGSDHTLTATVQPVALETSTADNTRSIVVAVIPVNDPPVAVDDTATTSPNTAVAISVLTNDTDEESKPLLIVEQPLPSGTTVNGGTVTTNGTTVTYTPIGGFTGQDTFDYKVCDPELLCDTGTVTVTVNAVASGPPAAPTGVSARKTGTGRLEVTWNDVAGNETNYDVQRCRFRFACRYSTVATLGANATMYTEGAALVAGATYRYRVRARNAAGSSAWVVSINIIQ
jgi:hypothetical protein